MGKNSVSGLDAGLPAFSPKMLSSLCFLQFLASYELKQQDNQASVQEYALL
jgi:hypothetical protein